MLFIRQNQTSKTWLLPSQALWNLALSRFMLRKRRSPNSSSCYSSPKSAQRHLKIQPAQGPVLGCRETGPRTHESTGFRNMIGIILQLCHLCSCACVSHDLILRPVGVKLKPASTRSTISRPLFKAKTELGTIYISLLLGPRRKVQYLLFSFTDGQEAPSSS